MSRTRARLHGCHRSPSASRKVRQGRLHRQTPVAAGSSGTDQRRPRMLTRTPSKGRDRRALCAAASARAFPAAHTPAPQTATERARGRTTSPRPADATHAVATRPAGATRAVATQLQHRRAAHRCNCGRHACPRFLPSRWRRTEIVVVVANLCMSVWIPDIALLRVNPQNILICG
jgi:hypothetical protein